MFKIKFIQINWFIPYLKFLLILKITILFKCKLFIPDVKFLFSAKNYNLLKIKDFYFLLNISV